MRKKNLMKNKGITLVALVITIILLLILAGITISSLTNSGLFENAKLAEQKSKEAQEEEEGILADYENKIANSTREVDNQRHIIEIDYVGAGTSYTTSTDSYWIDIPFTQGVTVGNKLTYKDNGVLIGDGVSTVKVSYYYSVESRDNSGGYFAGGIYINGNLYANSYMHKNISYLQDVSRTNIINVNKGDILTGKIFLRNKGTFLMKTMSMIVEVVD